MVVQPSRLLIPQQLLQFVGLRFTSVHRTGLLAGSSAWMASDLLQQDDDEAAAFAGYLEKYSVHVAKADFKFNAAHFVAYKGFRER